MPEAARLLATPRNSKPCPSTMSLCCFFLWPVLFCKSRCFKLSVQRHVSLRCPLGLTPVKAHTPPIRPLFFLPGAHRALPLDGAHCAGVLFPLGGAPRCLWCSPSRGPPPPPWSHSDRSSYPSMLLTEPGRSSPSVILLPLRDAPPPPWSHGDGSSYPSMVLTELGYSSPSEVLLPLRGAHQRAWLPSLGQNLRMAGAGFCSAVAHRLPQ